MFKKNNHDRKIEANHSGQSESRKIPQEANENSKRGPRRARENTTDKELRLAQVLYLIGCKNGRSFLDQSQLLQDKSGSLLVLTLVPRVFRLRRCTALSVFY